MLGPWTGRDLADLVAIARLGNGRYITRHRCHQCMATWLQPFDECPICQVPAQGGGVVA